MNYVQTGDSLQLTCRAESTPTPIIKWYKNKVPIDANSNTYRLINKQASNSDSSSSGNEDDQSKTSSSSSSNNQNELNLYIESVEAGLNTGDFSCLASNSEGSIEAHSQIILAIPAVIITMPRNQTIMEGNKVEFLCQAKALPSNITYNWFFNNKLISQLKWFESRYQVKRDGSLVIQIVHRNDQGEYKCQATNGLLHNNRLARKHKSQQHQQQQQQLNKQINNNLQQTTNANGGDNSNHNSNRNAFTFDGGAKSIMSENGGADSTSRVIYAEASAYLNVEFPARITNSPSIQYLPLGLSGLIQCYYESVPQIQFITWTLNNKQYDPNIDPNIERQLNGSLLIKQVSKSYEGQYRCTPFNSYGSAGSSGPMEVRVEAPPFFELKPADFYKATVNGQVRIPCDGNGSPKPIVSWRKVITTTSSYSFSSAAAAAATEQDENLNLSANANKLHQSLARQGRLVQSSLPALNELSTTSSSGGGGGITQTNAMLVNGGGGGGDELLDEQADDHHLYATASNIIPSTVRSLQQTAAYSGAGDDFTPINGGEQQSNDNYSSTTQNDSNKQTVLQTQQNLEETSTINYAPLPLDRSEFKNSHLILHNLRKEDYGRYECVVENEVATLVASTIIYIEGN